MEKVTNPQNVISSWIVLQQEMMKVVARGIGSQNTQN